jgi:hypothetical protein
MKCCEYGAVLGFFNAKCLFASSTPCEFSPALKLFLHSKRISFIQGDSLIFIFSTTSFMNAVKLQNSHHSQTMILSLAQCFETFIAVIYDECL